jgi:Predicted metal-dependent hydrolase of the TIM-barrel fold
MHIVDSQVHLWAAESPDRPWPPGRAPEAQKPYPIVKETMLFQMDLAKVSRVVIVPPSWEGDRNDLALEAARTYPDRFAVMGRLAARSRRAARSWRTGESSRACSACASPSTTSTTGTCSPTAPWIGSGRPRRRREFLSWCSCRAPSIISIASRASTPGSSW